MKNTRAVIIYLNKYISGKTLDFGAGSAKYRGLISPHTSEYITFDVVHGTNVDVVGDAHKTPFESNAFNTIICTQMLEHVEKPWIVIAEIKRILKPNGVCIITAPFLIPYHADPHDFFRYTREGLLSLFKNERFAIEESGTYGRGPSVLAEMFHFALFSHYKYERASKTKKRFRRKLMRTVKWFTARLDRLFSDRAVYANAYLVARKVPS